MSDEYGPHLVHYNAQGWRLSVSMPLPAISAIM
nr:hypothetical protein [Psychrobacter sp. WY6]